MAVVGWLARIITGIQPVFTFLSQLWYCFPFSFRVVFALFFSCAIGIVMIRSFIS